MFHPDWAVAADLGLNVRDQRLTTLLALCTLRKGEGAGVNEEPYTINEEPYTVLAQVEK